MTKPQRQTHVVLNFDSMTDTVTNLAGALILVVVLVLGITSRGAPSPPAVVEGIERVRSAIESLERQVRQTEQALPGLQQRVEERLRAKPAPNKTVRGSELPAPTADPSGRQLGAVNLSEICSATWLEEGWLGQSGEMANMGTGIGEGPDCVEDAWPVERSSPCSPSRSGAPATPGRRGWGTAPRLGNGDALFHCHRFSSTEACHLSRPHFPTSPLCPDTMKEQPIVFKVVLLDAT
jgi:hypothetical protein